MKPKLRILNLEDEFIDAELNQAMISARWPECELVRVSTRQEFVQALEAGGFDLILSDYTIPGFDGRSALQLAREKRPEVPFIFMSGTIGEDTAIEALKNGATDYVLKHRPIRLIPAVDRALREIAERLERARAEEAMRQSEYKYRELFESMSDAAFLADEQSEKIIDANRRAEALVGCDRSGVLGQKQSRFLALDRVHALPRKAGEEGYGTIVYACELTRVDGKITLVQVRSTRLTLYDRPLVLRLCHEISKTQPEQTQRD